MNFRKVWLKGFVLLIMAGFSVQAAAQCVNPFAFGSATFGTTEGQTVTATTCAFVSEYSTFNGLVEGATYEFVHESTSPDNYITLTDLANNILVHGPSPLTWQSTITGSVRFHYSNDAICTASPGGCREGRGTILVFPDETFSVGGTVSGLQGSGLVLQNNGQDDLPVTSDGSFTFSGQLIDGGAYNVTVLSQPSNPDQVCSVNNGQGNISEDDVTDIEVNCVTSVVMSVPVLSNAGLVLLMLLMGLVAAIGLRRFA